MKFAEALQQETRHHGPPCSVAGVLEVLDKDDRAALEAALAGDVPLAHISRALGTVGHKVAAHTLGRHRKRDCQCGHG